MRIALALALVIAATPLSAQAPKLEIVLPAKAELSTSPPAIRTSGLLQAGRTPELVRNGFPARLHFKLERWAAGTFVNDVKATVEWEMIASYDRLTDTYRLVRATQKEASVLGDFPSLREADGKLGEDYSPAIAPPRRGEKTYYILSLDVEAMSMSDLDEVQRWLRGELTPAVRGRKNAGTAVGTGVRTLFVRLLGGERVVYQVTTGVFKP